ncbi:aminopeptidase N [Thiomicrospira microaerophila]|uniref:aminopeptidase N n=1 Tax=Thiomicrospira microaerophila TaxID=406020 RepID=UPI0005C89028|nr:aminopeptidase N [Thiomicrospira microaerophila]
MEQVAVNYLKDYKPSDFLIERVDVCFELAPENTLVTNTMKITRQPTTTKSSREPLKLNGEGLELVSVRLNGKVLTLADYEQTDEYLQLLPEAMDFELEIVTRIHPIQNTALEGLYLSSGHFCTQCEAEGFRRITYFLDRPDVLSIYRTKIIADKQGYPVLLSNGNLVESGDLLDGKHYAVWQDPFKKPCYLFALVAGNLVYLEDSYHAADGRDIVLRIYTDRRHLPKCRHAMDSLMQAMHWDEQRFGLVYDLDIYMIVAVDDFNMGAMENKGLNVFNSKFVLADPQTATDVDYEGVEAVIAHEYFHNWTGNRVTCRDWFQLTLKEGLTVFRDQEFTAERLSPAVKRIEDVRRLRSYQFAEDAGPMAHPIQPQSYIEMNNFYTLTVYEKGAEVVRLYQTLLGRDGFRKGMDLYFARHDGQAVTVEDFRQAMADANQVDLQQMQAWYTQAGTPTLRVETKFDEDQGLLQLTCTQSLAQQDAFEPLLIPLKIGFLNPAGDPIKPTLTAVTQTRVKEDEMSYVLQVSESVQVFEFTGLSAQPYLSLLRDFSAPVKLDYAYQEPDLAFLARHDTDSFNKWEAAQRLALIDLMRNVDAMAADKPYRLGLAYAEVFGDLLAQVMADDQTDLALQAYALTLPDMNYLIEQYQQVNIEALTQAYQQMKICLASRYQVLLHRVYQHCHTDEAYSYNKQAIARRLMKNTCLGYLVLIEDEAMLACAYAQYQAQANMTDVQAALAGLSHHNHPLANQALADFYQRWQNEPLVLDKWFSIQASAQRADNFEQILLLMKHEKFSLKNPNRVRSLVGVFSKLNHAGFHRQDGAAYAWLSQVVLALDTINPQVAARMLTPLTQWRRFDAVRQALMLAELHMLKEKVKSKDVYELLEKSLLE